MSNIQPYIILNGTDSRSISGLLISSLPPISKPQVRTQIETVDGRDGDIVTPLGFSAYDKVIKIGLTYNYDVDEIIEFFNSEGIVTFSNEPDKYYRYAIYEQIDFEKLIRFKSAEVTLHVQPFKFSTTEEPELFDVVSGQAIAVTNEGNTDSRPNLTIIGSGDIDVSLNGSQILSIELENEQAVIIDSEDMNAYAAQSAIREVEVDIQAKQAGSGDPSPSNVRPISGFNSANIVRCGVNLCYQVISGASISGGGQIVSEPSYAMGCALLKKGVTYTVTTQEGQLVGGYFSSSPTIGSTAYDNTRFVLSNKTITPTKDCYIAFRMPSNYTTQPQVNIGSTALPYVAYNGQTYNIPFEQDGEPLTVYGGHLNVTTGELTITHGYYEITGAENWAWAKSGTYSGGFYTPVASVGAKLGRPFICTHAKTALSISEYEWGTCYCDGSLNFRIMQASDTVQDWKNYLASQYSNGTPVSICYELATPTEIQLTPTQIYNLLGVNNIYSDTGDITVKHKSNGVIVTDTGDIVSFSAGLDDIEKGVLLNRAITGDYDKIRLRKGVNTFVLTGNAQQFAIDKFSRWI